MSLRALVDFCMFDTLCILRTLAHTSPLQVLPPQWSPPRIFRLLWGSERAPLSFLTPFSSVRHVYATSYDSVCLEL